MATPISRTENSIIFQDLGSRKQRQECWTRGQTPKPPTGMQAERRARTLWPERAEGSGWPRHHPSIR
ncbi:unnamed protein product [Urochloa humidicola]